MKFINILVFSSLCLHAGMAVSGPTSPRNPQAAKNELSGSELPRVQELQELVAGGVTAIGNFNIQQFALQAQQLKVFVNKGRPQTATGQLRRSAMYSTKGTGSIILNMNVIDAQRPRVIYDGNDDQQIDATLDFHEILGATGYGDQDRDYAISSILSLTQLLLRLSPLTAFYQGKFDLWKQFLTSLHFEGLPELSGHLPDHSPVTAGDSTAGGLSARGGSTTTEGGGDYASAFYKHMMLYELLFETDELRQFTPEAVSVLNFLLQTKVEMDWKGKTARWDTKLIYSNGQMTLWLPPHIAPELVVRSANPAHPQEILKEILRLRLTEPAVPAQMPGQCSGALE